MATKVSITLSGGAIKGAFEVGALTYIGERMAFGGIEVLSVTGTSVGSLNGAMFAQDGDVARLTGVWLGLRNKKDLLKSWLLGYVQGYFKGGLYNFQPMRDLIEYHVDAEKLCKSAIKYACCSVDLESGAKMFVENVEENQAVIKDFIWASASIPTAVPPVKIAGRRFVDGGVSEPVPVEKAVELAPGADKHIVILADKLVRRTGGNPKCLGPIALQVTDQMFNEIFANDVDKGRMKYWQQQFVVVEPENVWFNDSFDVDPQKIRAAMADGYHRAKAALEAAGC